MTSNPVSEERPAGWLTLWIAPTEADQIHHGYRDRRRKQSHLPALKLRRFRKHAKRWQLHRTWNGESQIKTAGGVTYGYDGEGRRAAKVGSKLYWYGSGGEVLSETDAAGNVQNEYVFFGGKRVALMLPNGDKRYYIEDSLGSSRVVAGTGTVCYDGDFTPFGGERTPTPARKTTNSKARSATPKPRMPTSARANIPGASAAG